jgi:hypothetical protein
MMRVKVRKPRKRTSSFEAREDSAEALESPKEPFDLIAFLVEGAIVLPRFDAVGLGRDDGNHAEAEH